MYEIMTYLVDKAFSGNAFKANGLFMIFEFIVWVILYYRSKNHSVVFKAIKRSVDFVYPDESNLENKTKIIEKAVKNIGIGKIRSGIKTNREKEEFNFLIFETEKEYSSYVHGKINTKKLKEEYDKALKFNDNIYTFSLISIVLIQLLTLIPIVGNIIAYINISVTPIAFCILLFVFNLKLSDIKKFILSFD